MHIAINDRFRPFIKKPGSMLLFPDSPYALLIYPGKIIFFSLLGPKPAPFLEIYLEFQGTVDQFYAESDFERGKIHVRFATDLGENISFIFTKEGKLVFQKKPETLKYKIGKNPWSFDMESELPIKLPVHTQAKERLSFGVFKAQDFEKIEKRGRLSEFLPFWFFAGQLIRLEESFKENDSLFLDLEESQKTSEVLKKIIKVGFSGILCPSSEPNPYLGQVKKITSGPSIAILKKGYAFIRSLILREDGDKIHFLPALLKELPSGRMEGRLASGQFKMLWQKNSLKKLIFHSFKDQTLHFKFSEPYKSCRIRFNKKSQICKDFVNIHLLKGSSYYFDKFIK